MKRKIEKESSTVQVYNKKREDKTVVEASVSCRCFPHLYERIIHNFVCSLNN